MLISLDFLRAGARWPPEAEKDRLQTYRDNRRLYEDEHSEVYIEQMRRIERINDDYTRAIAYPVIINYQRLMSTKIADLVFGEPPTITAPNERQQQIIDNILTDTDLLNVAYMAAIDVSRYGDGLMLMGIRDGKPVVDVTSPMHWYPVVDPANIRRIMYHVFCWQYAVDDYYRDWRLRVQIHNPEDPTQCEQHTYKLNGLAGSWTIGNEIITDDDNIIDTGLGVCPVYRISNMLTSDRVYGLDDYQAIDSIVSELIVRISQVSRVLDKHANPSMSGPATALDQDPISGAYHMRAGGYYPRVDNSEPEVKYITWDASMDANFRQIELLTNQLYTVSEMGSAIFGDLTNKTGEVPSGSALRRLMMSPLAKARRIANKFDPILKQLISACATVYGEDIPVKDITITWADGLPDDEGELANIMAIRTGNRPTISQHTAIKRLDGASDKDASAELDEIRADDESEDMGSEPVLGVDAVQDPELTNSQPDEVI